MKPTPTVLALLLAAAPAAADQVTEHATGQKFETERVVDGKPYLLLGTGVRSKFGFKVYAMGLYVDAAQARSAFPELASRAGGRDHAHLMAGNQAQVFVAGGPFGKLGVMHFVRDVGADKIREAFEDGLKAERSDKAPPELRAAAQQFVGLFDRELKNGQEIILKTSADGRLEVEIAGQKKAGPQNPRLVQAIWNIWLGPHTISGDLRRGLVERIDQLGS